MPVGAPRPDPTCDTTDRTPRPGWATTQILLVWGFVVTFPSSDHGLLCSTELCFVELAVLFAWLLYCCSRCFRMTNVLAGGTGLTAPAVTFQTVVFGSASAVRRHTALLQRSLSLIRSQISLKFCWLHGEQQPAEQADTDRFNDWV